MTEGPLGGPRPFISQSCDIVYVFRVTGRPDREELLELEKEVSRMRRVDERKVIASPGKKRTNSNTYTLVVGFSQSMKIDTLEREVKSIRNKITRRGGRVGLERLAAGDPTQIADKPF